MFKKEQRVQSEQIAEDLKHATEVAVTVDGKDVKIVANVCSRDEMDEVLSHGGDGVGLLRTEMLFMDRAQAPSEDEQYEFYKYAAQKLGSERALVVRTLDVGGDKPLTYVKIDKEENPFLGERGIRVSLNQKELLKTQLRALLRASKCGNIHIMFPMISSMYEWCEAKKIFDDICEDLDCDACPLGMMMEVPSAAVMADVFAKEVDFFSIGTNDLTQYTLAMDRGHSKLAPQVDGLHPAVLKMMDSVVKAAHANGKEVAVCGDLARDAKAVPILIGIGVDELSVGIPAIPTVKAQVRELTASECVALAEKSLMCTSPTEVREL